ncbi:MAG TPA: hypothetical protein VEU97_09400 [Ktedonobacteraceae bacterium]|nr:hypothetical protein [Ktedonobacteraceae bacterium]
MQYPSQALPYQSAKPGRRVGFALCCLYASLACAGIGFWLSARARWSIPFVIGGIVFIFIARLAGRRSLFDYQPLIETAVIFWTKSFNIVAPSLFYFNQQQSQETRFEQQQVMLVNQRINLQDELNVLMRQTPLLTLQERQHPTSLLNDILAEDRKLLTFNQQDIQDLDSLIQSNYRQIELNSWVVPDSQSVNENDQNIQGNDQAINDIDQSIKLYREQTDLNNGVLPQDKQVTYQQQAYFATCPAQYACTPPPWQQSFIDGWQRVSKGSFTHTWTFWLALPLAWLLLLIVIPRFSRRYRAITYKVVSDVPLMKGDYTPVQAQLLLKDVRLLKLDIWSSKSLLTYPKKNKKSSKQKNDKLEDEDGQGFLSFEFDAGTTLWEVAFEGDVRPQVSFDVATGKVILQPIQSIPTKPFWGECPWYLYVVVDHFDGDVAGEAHINGLERFQELRGSTFLMAVARCMHALAWSLYIAIFVMVSIVGSFSFFNGLLDLNYNRVALFITMGLIVTTLLLNILEAAIRKSNVRQQRVSADIPLVVA